MFDPALVGYWGSKDHWQAMDTCLDVIAANAANIDGIKISLLSAEKEIAMRRRLPDGVKMYTGDDFNYPDLIAGDEGAIPMPCLAFSIQSQAQRHRLLER
jgi:hypothetical protein